MSQSTKESSSAIHRATVDPFAPRLPLDRDHSKAESSTTLPANECSPSRSERRNHAWSRDFKTLSLLSTPDKIRPYPVHREARYNPDISQSELYAASATTSEH